jgi:uncharacterized protein
MPRKKATAMPPASSDSSTTTITRPRTCWVLTDGKAGDENQCIGVAEALGLTPQLRRVSPGKPWVWLMPRGPVPPQDRPDQPGSPIAGPFPDLVIASGRRAMAYLRTIRKSSQNKTFTVILKDPRTGAGSADLIWVPQHDKLRAENVLVTLTSPHRLSQDKLNAARLHPPALIAALKTPRAAVIVGGNSRHHSFTDADIARFAAQLDQLAASGVSLMGSRSRRTPEPLATALAEVFAKHGGWWWDGQGENPYTALLANADVIIATADSVNMIGEATATGKPVLVFEPKGGHRKIGAFLEALKTLKAVHHFEGHLDGTTYQPLDSTMAIAAEILRRYRLQNRD